MNAGAAVAPGIAAAVTRTRRRILGHFEGAGATSPENSTSYEPSRKLERRAFDRFIARGVLVEAEQGSYWLDRVALADFRRRIGGRVLAAAGLALAVAGLATAFGR